MRATRPGEGARLREIRLASLLDAPRAFGARREDDAARPPEEWEALAAGRADAVAFVAEDGPQWLGMAGGVLPDGAGGATARAWGIWVAPGGRGRGTGRALLDAVVAWARGQGAQRVELSVTEHAPAAAAMYARAGFAPTGLVEPVKGRPELQQTWLELRLSEPFGAR